MFILYNHLGRKVVKFQTQEGYLQFPHQFLTFPNILFLAPSLLSHPSPFISLSFLFPSPPNSASALDLSVLELQMWRWQLAPSPLSTLSACFLLAAGSY